MTDSHVEPESDVRIVAKDGTTVVVQVKQASGRSIKYGVPRQNLDVVFTAKGILYPEAGESVAEQAAGGPTGGGRGDERMSEKDPLEGIVELSLSPDDARVVLDLVAEAWDDCADEAYSRGWMHDVAYEEMLHLNPNRVTPRTNPYLSDATSAPLAAEQPAEAAGGQRGDDEGVEG